MTMKADLMNYLLEINNEVIFQVKNNQKFTIEVYEYVNGLSNFIIN